MPRLILTISYKELDGLVKLALTEIRNPGDQARFMLRHELVCHGLLKEEQEVDKPMMLLEEGNNG